MTKERELDLLLKLGYNKTTCEIVVEVMDKIRIAINNDNKKLNDIKFSVSMRKTINIIENVKWGMEIKEAFSFAFLNGVNEKSVKNFQSIISDALVDTI